MSLVRKGKKSWKFFLQLRHNFTTPSVSPHSAHLGLQNSRIHTPRLSLHGSISSSCLLHRRSSPSFSTAAEAAPMAETEASSSLQYAEMEVQREHESSAPANAEQEETNLTKVVEEITGHCNSVRAVLEEHKALMKSIIDEIKDVKATMESKLHINPKRKWPEWTVFLEHLQTCKFLEDGKDSAFPEDPACIKRAIYKFSQAHDSVFESLSRMDLRIIARYGCTADDEKAALSQKRLRHYFQIDVKEIASDPKLLSAQPKLSDVTRLLHSTVSTLQDDMLVNNLKPSIRQLLREIITLSSKPSTSHMSSEVITSRREASASLSSVESDMAEISKQEKEKGPLKVEVAKPEDDTKFVGKAELMTKASQWKCPRCSFLNLHHKHRCVECSRRRPQSTYAAGTLKITNDASSKVVEAHVDEMQAKAATESLIKDSLSTRGLLKGRGGAEDIEVESSNSASDKDIKDNDSDDHFDILDDVLESETSDDEPKRKGKGSVISDDTDDVKKGKGGRAVLSDGSDEEGKGKGGRAVMSDDSDNEPKGKGGRVGLSDMFAQGRSPFLRRDGQRGMDQKRDLGKKAGRRPAKGKICDEEESSEGDDNFSRRGRGFVGSREDDYSRKPGRGRGGYNSFRGRGNSRGYVGDRGDSYDGRRSSEGGPRGMRAHRDMDKRGSGF